MTIKINQADGTEAGDYEVRFRLISDGRGTQAVHDAVVAYSAAQRSGTACTKTVAEVAGSGRKPWRQKGTGRARAGYVRSPIWRGGGVVFGPKPRSFRKRISRKTRRLALRKALGERLGSGDVRLVESFGIERPKTKDFLALLQAQELDGTVLVVTDAVDGHLVLSARNIPFAEVVLESSLNAYEVLKYDRLLFSRAAFEQVDARLASWTESDS